MENSSKLTQLLQARTGTFAPIIDHDLNAPNVALLDFSASNTELAHTDLHNTTAFDKLVKKMLQAKQAVVGIGGYFEHRVIYRRSQHFTSDTESRNIHLGIDIWAPAGVPIYAPAAGVVHSFQDNNAFSDYGPTLILEHALEGIPYYTLYGHLSRTSLDGKYCGKPIAAGEQIATMGAYPENGDWPPHLHFQLMTNLLGKSGDFPGVCAQSEEAFYRQICLNPNLLLNCKLLG